jgi:hypothetical protein
MRVTATIRNEKGRKQQFRGESPAQTMRDLVQKTNLKGKKFFISLVVENCSRRGERSIQSRKLGRKDLPYAFQEMLEKAKLLEALEEFECMECGTTPRGILIVQITSDIFN